jgi:hypothetical protein
MIGKTEKGRGPTMGKKNLFFITVPLALLLTILRKPRPGLLRP